MTELQQFLCSVSWWTFSHPLLWIWVEHLHSFHMQVMKWEVKNDEMKQIFLTQLSREIDDYR